MNILEPFCEPSYMGTSDHDPSAPGRPRLRVVRDSSRAVCAPGARSPAGSAAIPLPPTIPPDDAAAAAAYRRLVGDPEIVGFLHRYLRSLRFRGAELDDLFQDVLLSALKTFPEYSEERGELRPWLATIAERKAVEHWRQVERRAEVDLAEADEEDLADPGPHPEQAAITRQREGVCSDLFAGIPRRQLEALIARDVEGYTFKEMAALFGIPLQTAQSRYRAGRRKLKAAIEQRERVMRWYGLDGLPVLLLWLLSSKEAKAAVQAARRVAVRILLGALVVIAVLVAAVGVGSHVARATAPARVGVALVARASATKAGAVGARQTGDSVVDPGGACVGDDRNPGAGERSEGPPPSSTGRRGRAQLSAAGSGSEAVLMQRARAAVAAGNYAHARMLLEEHARDYPRGYLAPERAAFVRLLTEPHQP